MDFINGITILLIFELVGEASTLLLRLPIPGPVIGMMLLFLTLMWRKKIPTQLKFASSTLLSHLSLLFVPAGVGVMIHFELIRQELVAIILTLFMSTLITMTVTASTLMITQTLLSQRDCQNV